MRKVLYISKQSYKKNVPWHILAPAAVACDICLIRRSAHPRGAFFTLQKTISCKKIRRIITFYLLSFSGLFISLPEFTFSLFSLRMEYEVPFSQRLPLPAPSKVRFHWSFHRLFPGGYIRPYPPAAFASADSNPRSYQ